ncbi:FAD-dependent oxidoreductase [Azospirillum sp. TSO22-1]|uniref:FAD-dependent oxidoreductase n=1 Tax=Azospirillum sp. TSO22-1 TaxID=716789 RepID=UPI000D61030C|nr:FAD-dependent oxidoreductase [Azospirillum sp. TSO22-1]PWC41388.1 hypothetical protein TSO221_23520 [Azospirillum sp. TSO22-1]
MQGSGSTTSVWMATATTPQSTVDPQSVRPDVVVIGAGIAGASVAYFLQRSGKTVLLLDDGAPGDGETGRTTAHLSNAIDDRFTEIERLHGREGARLAAESHGAAIDAIERICREEGIACDFARLDGWLMAAPGQDPAEMDKELAAAHRAGLTGVEKHDHAPGIAHPGPALRFPDQGMLHPLKYLSGLVEAFRRRGGTLATGAHVTTLEEITDGVRVHIHGGAVDAKAVVVATNAPISDRVAIHSKQAPYRTYVLGLKVARDALPTALWWDDLDPYHYVRLQSESDHAVLIVGGEDHKTGEADDMDLRYARLEAWTREHFPMAGEVQYRWSGQVMEPFDGLAFIGRDPAHWGHVFIVTGDSGMGMTHGTLAGLMLCELVHGHDHPWATLYDPSRKMIRKLGTYLRENLDAARHLARTAFGPSDVDSEDRIKPGEGAIMKTFARPVAVYRDEQGHLHRMSAVCPHLKCTVEWNSGEKTWDCPCHGSRFACDGAVLNGPATSALARVGQEVDGRVK